MAPLNVLLFLLLLIYFTDAAQFVSLTGDLLKLLVKSSTGEVVVSSDATLYTLSAGLTVKQTNGYGGYFRMLAQSDIGHFMSCDSIQCNLTGPSTSISFPSNIAETATTSSRFLRADTTVVSATIIPVSNQNLIYVHKSEKLPNSRLSLNIGNITLINSTFTLAGEHDESLYAGLRSRSIVSTIRTDEYFYYVINHVQSEDEFNVRLVRICANDTGITVMVGFLVYDRFDSYYELKLQCGNNLTNVLASSATYYNGAGGPHIIVSFTEHTDSGVEHDNIVCAFKESVISSMITEKFTQCSVDGDGRSGLSITEQQQSCIPAANGAVLNECMIGKDNGNSLELDTPYTGNVVLNSSSRIVSMLSFNNFGYVSLFAASDDDQVHKYTVFANSTSMLSLRESFAIPVGPVTSLAASPNGSLLYVLTPNKVMSYSSEQCDQYSSCHQCLDQVDPVCGWCLLDSECSTQESCSSQFWVTSNGASSDEQCPRGYITNDVNVSTEDLPYNVTVQVGNLPMEEFDCAFVGTTPITAQAVWGSSSTITCTLNGVPNSMFTDTDTIVLTSSLRLRDSSQTFLDVTGNITVFDCTVYARCSDCLNSKHVCTWCPYNALCTARPETRLCTSSVTTVDSCPQLTIGGPYTLHMGVNEQLMISGRNFIQSGNNYYCVVTYGGVTLSVTASWDPVQMMITCYQRNYFFPNAAGSSTATAGLEVIWKTPDNVNYTIDEISTDVQVTLYQCSLLGPDCTSCLAQERFFNCVYCESTSVAACLFSSSCINNSFIACPAPRIHQFSPAAGPVDGGTVISINGSNLGMRFEDIKSIMIGDAHCNPNRSSYIVGRRINCVTADMEGPYSNNIIIVTDNGNHTSTDQFYYKMVRLDGVTPNIGPASGGTVINITGQNLNIGNTQTVLVGGNQCMIKNITLGFITCETPENSEGVVTVMVSVDRFTGTTRENFEYVRDPVFTDIIPKFSFTSGGTQFRVFGERLDVVQSPEILFTITSRKRQAGMENYRAPCKAINATLLSCEAPALPSNIYGSADQQVTLGLVMDGVVELLELNVMITVNTDPVFFPLTADNSSLVFERGEYGVINITGCMFRFEQGQVVVRISNISTCRVIQKSSNYLECIPVEANYPLDTDIPIMVTLGNLDRFIGSIRYDTRTSTSTTNLVIIIVTAGTSIAICILILIIIVVMFKCLKRHCHFSLLNKTETKSYSNVMVDMYVSPAYGTHQVFTEPGLDHLYEPIDTHIYEENKAIQDTTSPADDNEVDTESYLKMRSSGEVVDQAVTEGNMGDSGTQQTVTVNNPKLVDGGLREECQNLPLASNDIPVSVVDDQKGAEPHNDGNSTLRSDYENEDENIPTDDDNAYL